MFSESICFVPYPDSSSSDGHSQPNILLILQDERLARFVTGSHMKHHPNATEAEQDENLVSMDWIVGLSLSPNM